MLLPIIGDAQHNNRHDRKIGGRSGRIFQTKRYLSKILLDDIMMIHDIKISAWELVSFHPHHITHPRSVHPLPRCPPPRYLSPRCRCFSSYRISNKINNRYITSCFLIFIMVDSSPLIPAQAGNEKKQGHKIFCCCCE